MRIFVVHALVARLRLLGSNILVNPFVNWQFVSAPQTTPRTANTCGNKKKGFVPCDDSDVRPNPFLSLKPLHTSYFSPWIKYRREGSSIRSINIMKPKEIHATCVINKFWKFECHVFRDLLRDLASHVRKKNSVIVSYYMKMACVLHVRAPVQLLRHCQNIRRYVAIITT